MSMVLLEPPPSGWALLRSNRRGARKALDTEVRRLRAQCKPDLEGR